MTHFKINKENPVSRTNSVSDLIAHTRTWTHVESGMLTFLHAQQRHSNIVCFLSTKQSESRRWRPTHVWSVLSLRCWAIMNETTHSRRPLVGNISSIATFASCSKKIGSNSGLGSSQHNAPPREFPSRLYCKFQPLEQALSHNLANKQKNHYSGIDKPRKKLGWTWEAA